MCVFCVLREYLLLRGTRILTLVVEPVLTSDLLLGRRLERPCNSSFDQIAGMLCVTRLH
jgi:hypothetical protein